MLLRIESDLVLHGLAVVRGDCSAFYDASSSLYVGRIILMTVIRHRRTHHDVVALLNHIWIVRRCAINTFVRGSDYLSCDIRLIVGSRDILKATLFQQGLLFLTEKLSVAFIARMLMG